MDYHLDVCDLLQYIEMNLESKLKLDDLARRAYLSKYHYHRLFHRATGESISKYITKRRMEKAAEELAQTERPIIDIALKFQYASQESFSRAFTRIYGITPGKYRKMHVTLKNNNVINLGTYLNKTVNMAA